MAIEIPQGTKEYLIVDVTDALQNLGSLSGASPQYTVYDPDGTAVLTNQAAVASGMSARCMIDTTTGGPWPGGEYELYLRLTAAPEIPLIGPLRFEITPTPV